MAITTKQIEEYLVEVDGTCRDITFKSPTWDGAANLIRWFFQNYIVRTADTAEGTDVRAEFASGQPFQLSDLPGGSIFFAGENSKALIRDLQIFIGNPENGEITPFVELTFFPDDLSETFTISDFVHLVEDLKQKLQANWYYVRTENASWKFGSSGIGTGVIFQPSDVTNID